MSDVLISNALIVERKPPLAFLKLNRKDSLNSLNRELLTSLVEACKQLENDPEIRVVIIIGSGDKAFCAGADLKERKGMSEGEVIDYIGLIQRTMQSIEKLPQVVIAAINGSAFGGGFELALSCDLRIMVSQAIMRLTEVRLGIIPGAGGTQRLSRLIGKSRTKELILASKAVSAEEALNIGLVHKIIQGNAELKSDFNTALIEETTDWAMEIAQAAPLSLKQAKKAIDEGYNLDQDSALAVETRAYLELLNTQDRLEGLKAFAEKRQPVYTGK